MDTRTIQTTPTIMRAPAEASSLRRPVIIAIVLALALGTVGCDLFENDGLSTDPAQPSGGFFYLIDRASVSIIQLDAQLRELRRWDAYALVGDSSLQGLAFDGTYLWLSSAGSTDRIFQVDMSGDALAAVRSFDAPPQRQGTVRDLAWDGATLWCLNSGSTTYATPAMLYRLNPADGAILAQYPVPSPEPRGLTWVGDNGDVYGRGADPGLYYCDVTTDMVYKFHADRPLFDTAFAAPVPPRGVSYIYPVGITFDGGAFWVVNSSNTADHLTRVNSSGRENLRYDLPYEQPGPLVWAAKDAHESVPLSLTGVLPSTGVAGSVVSLEVFGSGFRPGPSLALGLGADVVATGVTFVDPGKVRATVTIAPAAVPGVRAVTLTNGNGRSVTSDSLFQVTLSPVTTGYLWLAEQDGDSLYRIRVSDTSVVGVWDTRAVSSAGSPQGVASDGTNIWLCASGTDRRIYKLDTSGGALTALSSFAVPVSGGTLRGIVWDNGSLWMAVSTIGKLYKLDPVAGTLLDSVATPGIEPRGVALANGSLYVNDVSIDSVFVLDLPTRVWTSVFATPTPTGGTTGNRFATGLAWDGTNFWIANSTGNFDHVYRLSPLGAVLQQFEAPRLGLAQVTGLVHTAN